MPAVAPPKEKVAPAVEVAAVVEEPDVGVEVAPNKLVGAVKVAVEVAPNNPVVAVEVAGVAPEVVVVAAAPKSPVPAGAAVL